MDRALRRYTELINDRNKLNKEHPEWNFVDVVQLTEKLIAIRIPVTQRQVAFLAEQMPTDPTIKTSLLLVQRIDSKEIQELFFEDASENLYYSVLTYWKEALQLTDDEYEKIKPVLEAAADSWVE